MTDIYQAAANVLDEWLEETDEEQRRGLHRALKAGCRTALEIQLTPEPNAHAPTCKIYLLEPEGGRHLLAEGLSITNSH